MSERIKPLDATLQRDDPDQALWSSDPDACCRIRKVEPLARALEPFSAWFNGRKRFQGGERAAMAVVEADGARLKFNPLANATADDLKALYASAKLPPHPLLASGFTSIGCMPCTTRTKARRGSARGPLARSRQDRMRHSRREGFVAGGVGVSAKYENPFH